MSQDHIDQDDQDDRTIIRPAASPLAGGGASGVAPVPAAAPAAFVPLPTATASVPSAPAVSAALPAAHEFHNALAVGTYLGEFEIQGVIGEGGFGIVYLAWDHSLQRRVALKEYMPSALASRGGGQTVSVKSERHRETFQAGLSSFVNEARLLAQFDHASLVKVYRFWEAHGTAYMVMPFYEGVTLKDTLKDLGGPPDEAWLTGLLAPLTEALEVIHAEQCYHRDIAPDNVILLKGTQRPLLLDFGAARRVIGDMTQALTVILKPGYAPVEQYAEVPGMKQGPWTDVYALAALVYNAITGKTPPTSVGRLMNDNYQPLAEVAKGRYSDRFLQAIDHALKVKPDERTPNIAALRAELGLDAAVPASQRTVMPVAAMPTVAKPSGASAAKLAELPGKTSGSSKKTGLMVAGGLGALVLLGGAAWMVLGGPPAAQNASALQGQAAASVATAAASSAAVVAPTTPPAVASAPLENSAASVPSAPASPQLAPKLDGPFEPLNEFRRIVAMADTSFQVEAMPSKPQFRIGKDRLGFKVSSAKEGYVYVLLQSTEGAFMRLFPNTMGKDNRIKAGQILVLPQPSWPMDTAGPAGTDHFLVIVSEHPRDFKQAHMKMDGGFGEYPVGEQALALLRQKPTGTSPFAGQPQCPQGDACPDVFGAALFSSEEIQ
jgi:serine/threonine protein kinase